ncbi:MAG: type II toxin-antitoxin system VapC family toxin [Candidatus Aenigmarchaeota archaeon]|nr:type II toxin-antitoxin system VapC family toxin [Candidatus Aenigmarchaeota archaeon]
MGKIIIDSDVLIDFLKSVPQATEKIKELEEDNELGTTDINAFELYLGAYKSKKQEKELADVKGLLNTLFLSSADEDSMEIAAKILSDLEKRGKPLALRDLFIGSICLTNSFKLFTRNKKHFESIEGLELV